MFSDNKEAFIVANALMLFVGGFDTQGFTLSQILHNLVKNSVIQDILIKHIDEALEETEGSITYDLVENIQYLDWVIKESMR